MNDCHHTFALRIERINFDQCLLGELLAVSVVTLTQVHNQTKKSAFCLIAELEKLFLLFKQQILYTNFTRLLILICDQKISLSFVTHLLNHYCQSCANNRQCPPVSTPVLVVLLAENNIINRWSRLVRWVSGSNEKLGVVDFSPDFF